MKWFFMSARVVKWFFMSIGVAYFCFASLYMFVIIHDAYTRKPYEFCEPSVTLDNDQRR